LAAPKRTPAGAIEQRRPHRLSDLTATAEALSRKVEAFFRNLRADPVGARDPRRAAAFG
jgi:hypothetical protein